MSTALRSVGRLDVLSSMPAAPSGCAPGIHARLRRLATKSGEKSGLAGYILEAMILARAVSCSMGNLDRVWFSSSVLSMTVYAALRKTRI
jgi:hypothetical protein